MNPVRPIKKVLDDVKRKWEASGQKHEKLRANELFDRELNWKKNFKAAIKNTLANGGRFFKRNYTYDIPWNLIHDVNDQLKNKTDWAMTWTIQDRDNAIPNPIYEVTFYLNKKEDIIILPDSF